MERRPPDKHVVVPTADQARAAGLPKDIIEQMESEAKIAGLVLDGSERVKAVLRGPRPRGVEFPMREPVHKLSVDERRARRVKNRTRARKRSARLTGGLVSRPKYRRKVK